MESPERPSRISQIQVFVKQAEIAAECERGAGLGQLPTATRHGFTCRLASIRGSHFPRGAWDLDGLTTLGSTSFIPAI